jgi:hypothetical protein
MDALFTIAGVIAVLIVFAVLSVAIGADSRDGFAGPSPRSSLH